MNYKCFSITYTDAGRDYYNIVGSTKLKSIGVCTILENYYQDFKSKLRQCSEDYDGFEGEFFFREFNYFEGENCFEDFIKWCDNYVLEYQLIKEILKVRYKIKLPAFKGLAFVGADYSTFYSDFIDYNLDKLNYKYEYLENPLDISKNNVQEKTFTFTKNSDFTIEHIINTGTSIIKLWCLSNQVDKSIEEIAKSIDYKEIKALDRIMDNNYSKEKLIVENNSRIVAGLIKRINYNSGDLKRTYGSKVWDLFLENKHKGKRKNEKGLLAFFRNDCPLIDKKTEEFCRRAYIGGYNNYKNDMIDVMLENVMEVDMNGAYGFSLAYDKLPVLEPKNEILLTLDKNCKSKLIQRAYLGKLFIVEIFVKYAMVKPNCPSMLIKKHEKGNSEYCSELINETLYLTTPDFLNFIEYNEVDYEVITIISFKECMNKFRNFIENAQEEKVKAKEKNNIVDYWLAKNKQNMLVGKLGLKPILETKKMDMIDQNGLMKYKKIEVAIETKYVPISAFVNGYQRRRMAKIIHSNWDRWIASNTDNFYFIDNGQPLKGIEYDQLKLGSFKIEYVAKKFKILGRNIIFYEKDDGIINAKVSGINNVQINSDQFNWDNITFDGVIKNAIRNKMQVKGGAIRIYKDFVLKSKYQ